ncbi:MAG: UbiX family flavin prenyltransferase [Alphaproteobacteria bacterium]
MGRRRRLIVGISGASGALYGIRVLEMLRNLDVETHLIVSRAAELTLACETDLTLQTLTAMADACHRVEDLTAAPASGSFSSLGMIIAPCSIRTLSEIATGTTSSLLTRAADVTLKERRRLVLMVRETPLHLGHLRTMVTAAEIGAVIAPPVPAFYTRPETLADVITQSVGRVLDLFGLEAEGVGRWREA